MDIFRIVLVGRVSDSVTQATFFIYLWAFVGRNKSFRAKASKAFPAYNYN
jgi:hypothetical protein